MTLLGGNPAFNPCYWSRLDFMSLEDIDKKFEELVSRVDKRFEELGKKLEDRFSYPASSQPKPKPSRTRDSIFWGAAMMVVGLVLLANHFHWLSEDVPVIPTVLILLGLYLILENR
jgi:hypothetical protein